MISNVDYYKSFFDESLDLHCVFDLQGRFLEWNQAWSDILGYSPSEIKNSGYAQFLHTDDVKETEKVHRYLLETGMTNGFVNRYISKKGNTIYLEWKASVVGEKVFASARNITKSRDLLEEVQELNALHADVTSHMCSAFLVVSEGLVEHSNRRYKDYFGMPGQAVADINRQMIDLIDEAYWDDWKECYASMSVGSERAESIIKKTVKVNGHPYIKWMRVKIVSGVRSSHYGRILCYFIDDTDNMKRIEEVEHALEQVKLANDSKRRFIANISHDLRTPLNGVSGMLELALMTAEDDEQRSMLNTAFESAKKLNRIIDDILRFSNRDVRLSRLNKSEFHLLSLVEDVIDKSRSTEDMEGPKPIIQLCETDECFNYIESDPEVIKEIFSMLIRLALEYSASKDIRLYIKRKFSDSSMTTLQAYVEIERADYDNSPRKCDFLYDESTRQDAGMLEDQNMDMLMLRSLAEALGGRSWNDFSLLDCIQIGVDFSVSAISQSPVRDQSEQCEKKEILLVDKLCDDYSIMKAVLAASNVNVSCSNDGLEGLKKLKIRDYDVFIIGLDVLYISGYEIAKEIRKGLNGSEKKIVAIVEHADEALRKSLIEKGFDDLVSRPLDWKTVDAIAKLD